MKQQYQQDYSSLLFGDIARTAIQQKHKETCNMIEFAMPMHEYLAHEALSRSSLIDLLDCPARFYYNHVLGGKSETKPMVMGQAFHCLALEPQHFDEKFYIMNHHTKNEKHAAYQEDKVKANGRTMLKQKEYDELQQWLMSLKRNPYYQQMTQTDQVEVNVFWQEDGIAVKSRLDYLNNGVVVDLKTCSSLNKWAVQDHIWRYGVDMQAAMNLDGLNANGYPAKSFVLIMIEKEAPYLTRTFEMSPSLISRGRQRYKDALGIYKECKANDEWPGYEQEIETLEVING